MLKKNNRIWQTCLQAHISLFFVVREDGKKLKKNGYDFIVFVVHQSFFFKK